MTKVRGAINFIGARFAVMILFGIFSDIANVAEWVGAG